MNIQIISGLPLYFYGFNSSSNATKAKILKEDFIEDMLNEKNSSDFSTNKTIVILAKKR